VQILALQPSGNSWAGNKEEDLNTNKHEL